MLSSGSMVIWSISQTGRREIRARAGESWPCRREGETERKRGSDMQDTSHWAEKTLWVQEAKRRGGEGSVLCHSCDVYTEHGFGGVACGECRQAERRFPGGQWEYWKGEGKKMGRQEELKALSDLLSDVAQIDVKDDTNREPMKDWTGGRYGCTTHYYRVADTDWWAIVFSTTAARCFEYCEGCGSFSCREECEPAVINTDEVIREVRDHLEDECLQVSFDKTEPLTMQDVVGHAEFLERQEEDRR
jgi:hypothetical protein